MKLTTAQAHAIYDILVEECGASRLGGADFVDTQTKTDCPEYRFMGSLGFGGKFRNRDHWYVDCYQEDETAARLAAIGRANERLVEFQQACRLADAAPLLLAYAECEEAIRNTRSGTFDETKALLQSHGLCGESWREFIDSLRARALAAARGQG